MGQRISIVSLDTKRNTRICKIDIRTRGGQSYSFGQHCPFGLPQTLDLFPGERILKVSLAFLDIQKDAYRRNTVTLGSLCIITTYGGVLKSGKASCDTAVTVKEPNSGILAGIGGRTRLDDTGIEYISSLFLIFHPWPEKLIFDLSSYKFLGKEPTQGVNVQDECLGNKAYCRSDSRETTNSREVSNTQERSRGRTMSESSTTGTSDTTSSEIADSQSFENSATRSNEVSDTAASQGTTRGRTATQGQQRTQSRERTVGSEVSESSSESNTMSQGFSRTVDYNPDKYNVRMWLTTEEYKDMPYRATALLYTRGLGGVLPIPVSGVLNGRFASARSFIDNTLEIDCGGPKPEEISKTVVLLEEALRKWTLVMNPTSFRHAYDYCNDIGAWAVRADLLGEIKMT
ncbi:hypothetical protein HYH03_011636 [Edaphochlamys debaryana]|uniref:Uncharacterized protein n=1 Tax=Edaphochlamys debaryana TaxID=47281 RepID=A0A835XVI6_9CHLO|nr:hypothetical protein HYH03_011636 [Edaphochlamys debaryana]|eukprot:KAG2489833.1 hypothetical protein HYH03_011636 [Edaphochlamys debaryana]